MSNEYGRIHTDGSRSGGQPALKPCPFCGGRAEIAEIETEDLPLWLGECLEPPCEAAAPVRPTRDEAIAAWNTRQPTQSDALRERCLEAAAIAAWNIRQPTQSDSLADKSDDYAIGYLSVLLERELYQEGWIIGEDLAEKLAEIAVKTVRQPTQSDALREALRNIQIEAEREKGSWVHLKRVIALNCKAALEQST